MTHSFIMTFADIAARDAYIVHPEHERFKAMALTTGGERRHFRFRGLAGVRRGTCPATRGH